MGTEQWTCERIAALIPGEYMAGKSPVPPVPYPNDAEEYRPGWIQCHWSGPHHASITLSVIPDPIGEAGVEAVRSGAAYEDDPGPLYLVQDSDRLRAIGAAAVATDDSGPDHGSVFVHTPTIRISVVAATLDSALEIGTRIAEADH